MGVLEIEAFLLHLAQEGDVSASTQNQAFNAILFLYRNVLKIELAAPIHALWAKRSQHLPTVLSKSEVSLLLSEMQGLHQLMSCLLYGSGLRLMECLRLRVKDIDFEQSQIVVREGTDEKDRLTIQGEITSGTYNSTKSFFTCNTSIPASSMPSPLQLRHTPSTTCYNKPSDLFEQVLTCSVSKEDFSSSGWHWLKPSKTGNCSNRYGLSCWVAS
jgi:hypothetical protein